MKPLIYKFIGKLYLFCVIFGGILLLIEIHTGKLSQLTNKYKNNEPVVISPTPESAAKPEEDPAEFLAKLERYRQNHDFAAIIRETDGRKDKVALAYRTIAVFESGMHENLLPEAMGNMKMLIGTKDLPDDLHFHLVKALGDPESPGPSARENLEAYKQIVADLKIATHSSTLKKIHELEKLAENEEEEKNKENEIEGNPVLPQ